MQREYYRVQVNQALLNGGDSEKAKKGTVTDTFPYRGKLVGVCFIPYNKDCGCKEKGGQEFQHTEIRIEDTRGRLLTGVTDIKDYLSESWAKESYKELNFPIEQNERIMINYNTVAGNPIVGEFVFVIDAENSNSCGV